MVSNNNITKRFLSISSHFYVNAQRCAGLYNDIYSQEQHELQIKDNEGDSSDIMDVRFVEITG